MAGSTETDKRELQRLALEAQAAQQQGTGLQQQLASIQGSIIETRATMETLKNLEKLPGKEVLLPLGSGVFVNAGVTGKGKVLVEIGSNIITEKNFAEANELLESHLKLMEDTRGKLQNALDQLSARMQALDQQARGLVSKIKEE